MHSHNPTRQILIAHRPKTGFSNHICQQLLFRKVPDALHKIPVAILILGNYPAETLLLSHSPVKHVLHNEFCIEIAENVRVSNKTERLSFESCLRVVRSLEGRQLNAHLPIWGMTLKE